MGEAGGTEQPPWRHPKARFFGAPPRFFAQEQRNGVERAVGATIHRPTKRRTRTIPRQAPAPSPSRAKMSNDNRGSSAHADGGATGVKRRFSLAARHRFFGQAPKKWGRKAEKANDPLPKYRRTRTNPKAKRGNPRRGFPLKPPPALMRAQESSALKRSAGRGSAPAPRRL